MMNKFILCDLYSWAFWCRKWQKSSSAVCLLSEKEIVCYRDKKTILNKNQDNSQVLVFEVQ